MAISFNVYDLESVCFGDYTDEEIREMNEETRKFNEELSRRIANGELIEHSDDADFPF